jgi:hypothetical protein
MLPTHSAQNLSIPNNYFAFFRQVMEKIWNCRDCRDQIWIDHFDHENFGILGMGAVKIGLTILTIETQFWPNGQKS